MALAKPLSTYTVSSVGGVNVYWREFEKGYVAVNPTANNVATLALPQPVQQITHANVLSAICTLRVFTSIPLPGHNAAILVKAGSGGGTGADTSAPSVPAGLAGTAVSSTQVNLTWNASTDNVGVKGYTVFVNDTQ